MICTKCPGCSSLILSAAGYARFSGRDWCSGCARDYGIPGHLGNKVSEIYLDFTDGEVSGDISDCTRNEVADALERIARVLRSESTPLDYVDFDEGKISAPHAK